jgi:hypothetical protein
MIVNALPSPRRDENPFALWSYPERSLLAVVVSYEFRDPAR